MQTKHFLRYPFGEVHPLAQNFILQRFRYDGMPLPDVLYLPYEGAPDVSLNDWFMAVLLMCEARRSMNNLPFDLILPYLPYSRQDRRTKFGEPFSLKVIGKMLNQCGAARIITLDAHSDMAAGLIDNLVNVPQKLIWRGRIHDNYTLILPDYGAFKKSIDYAEAFAGYAIAIKTRDTDTGRVEIRSLVPSREGMDLRDRDCMILDDLCDGGATFIQLAEVLYEKHGVRKVDLSVTHGGFTKGLEPLREAGIQVIQTTNSLPQNHPEGSIYIQDIIEILKENQYL